MKYTIETYRTLPESAPFELIRGDLVMVPAPNWKHQRISRRLEHALILHVEHEGLGEIFGAPVDVYFDDTNILQPDIVFIAKDRKSMLGDKWYIQGAPDLVIEILSPTNSSMDAIEKMAIYERFGVREHWIVDPELRTMHVHILENGRYRLVKQYCGDEPAASVILPGFSVMPATIFEDLPA
ncbi:MAG TPA: Uma2 family endonuclease [Spirochaetota bacterium]|nr:Uma2 family endonuclease [Spirochaetota bacterium]HOS41302.1 Uma2 family endonuclease [Spirochaetota bacterium]HPI23414.1 Uma2 family endonuclease [Spirochaetota bacterium]HPU86806.1 Uma2 family endonuclease [Spirochaetota bacterium]